MGDIEHRIFRNLDDKSRMSSIVDKAINRHFHFVN